MAIEMIAELEAAGIQYKWIGVDSLYGRNYEFRKALEALGQKFIVDIQDDHHIYMQPPHLYIPERKSNLGQKPKRYIYNSEPDKYNSAFCNLIILNGNIFDSEIVQSNLCMHNT